MQRLPPLESGRSAGPDGSGTLPWQPGQKLTAAVLRGADTDGQAVIRIGRTELLAETHLPLVRGDRLAIEVARVEPKVSLRVTAVHSTSHASEAVDNDATLARAALRQLAPRQNALGPLLATLIDARGQSGDKTLRAAITRLLDNLPAAEDIVDPVKLKSALAQATSTRPATTQSHSPPALRTLLLDLLSAAQQAAGEASPPRPATGPPPPPPGEALTPQPQTPAIALPSGDARGAAAQLRNLVDGALARGAMHQLSANLQSTHSEPLLYAELPVRRGDAIDVVPFRIRRDGSRRNLRHQRDRSAPWKVSLALNLPGMGALHARLTLTGSDLSARFWTPDPQLRQTVDEALPTLATALDRCGLKAAHLSCHRGDPPPDKPPIGAPDDRLLDTRA